MSKTRDEEITEALAQCFYDPLKYVYFSYPWGKDGPLKDETGPDEWQKDALKEIGQLTRCQHSGELWTDYKTGKKKKIGKIIRYAIKAGRGPGKTCLFAWIIDWFIKTRPHAQGTILANTKTQLDTKTWRELAKWHNMSITSHRFNITGTKFAYNDKKTAQTWFAAAIPWKEEKAQAIAGMHEAYVLSLFDEASEIPDIIWTTIGSGLTDPFCLWIVGGNPTKNTGYFKECFDDGSYAHRWIQRTIDARDAKKTNKEGIAEAIEDHDGGENSDYVKVWVRGEFPSASVEQFIPLELVKQAIATDCDVEQYHWRPIVFGIDCMRHGDDENIIYIRQWNHTHEILKYPDMNEVDFAVIVADKMNEWHPQAVNIDYASMGGGLIDILHKLGHTNVYRIVFQGRAAKSTEHYNKRAEMGFLAKQWLSRGGSLPDNRELKKYIKKKLGRSPDTGDAFFLTFAVPLKDDLDLYAKKTPAEEIIAKVTGKWQNANTYIPGLNMMQ